MRVLTFAVLAFALLFSGSSVFAAATVDPAFNPVTSRPIEGGSAMGQALQPDGKMLIWGAYLAVNGLAKGQVARLNSDGSVDTSFSYCTCQGLSSIESVAVQNDGKILLSGRNDANRGQVTRINSDGSHDSSYWQVFAGAVPPVGGGSAIIWAVLPDNKTLVERFESQQGFSSRSLYRLNTDGSIDSTFTTYAIGAGQLIQTYLNSLAVAPDGKIYLGRTTYSGPSSSATLSRINANGTADSWEVPSLTMGGSPSQTSISSLSVQSDGNLLVSGNFDTVNGVPRIKLVRLLPAGNVDMGFSGPSFFSVGTIRPLSNGKILIGASSGLGNPGRIFRLNSDGSQDGTFVMDPTITGVNNKFAIDGSERPVFFGTSTLGTNYFRLDINGSWDQSFASSTAAIGIVKAIARQTDGKIIVAGTFSQMNTTARPSFARIDPDGTTDPTFDPGTGFSSTPTDIVLQTDGKIIAFGQFSTYNGTAVSGMIRINSNGSLDNTFSPVVTNVNGVSFQTDGKLLIAGSFSTLNGDARSRVARLNADGTTDLSFNANITSGTVNTAQQLSDGKIIIGGGFTGVDGFNRSNFVRVNSNGTLDTAFNPSSPPTIARLYIQPDGRYLFINGANSGIGQRNADGTNDATFAAPTFTANSDLRIYTLAVQSDGSIIVGGLFNLVGGVPRNNLVRLNSSGKVDKLFFQKGAGGTVYASLNEPGGTTILGGDYWRIDTIVRGGLARVVPGAFSSPSPFDYDGDGRADVSVFRASENKWYILRSSDTTVFQPIFAVAGDIPAPADFDGDGLTDVAIFRPSNGDWWYLSSATGQQINARWGLAGDIPMPSDYDGDGRADYVLFRPSSSQWVRASSANGSASNRAFGVPGDKPLIGDFDGDGRSDVAIYRPSDGNWWWWSSFDNVQRATRWGIATDIPAPADYDGDSKTDFAVYRPSTGVWYIVNSSSGAYSIFPFGIAEDRPVAADYDGDGKADPGVFRPSTGIWYLLRTTAGFTGLQFGNASDVPTQSVYLQ
ncbi:MAG: VCBS repeat-containing protein [Acidobacteria bacterium]|nr:VCBS repeat-containing protein [Acidobacteriota bacterium]